MGEFGYIRKMNNMLLKYAIPTEISFICLSYYFMIDSFEIHHPEIRILNQTTSMKTSEDDLWCSAYGTIPIQSNSTNHYQWTIKINKTCNTLAIGIATNRNINGAFHKHKSITYGYHSRGHKFSSGKWEKYGDSYTSQDIIIMDIDLVLKQIKFVKNNKDQGVAFKNIICAKKPYYLAISSYFQYDSVSICRFLCTETT
eukprot:114678_1